MPVAPVLASGDVATAFKSMLLTGARANWQLIAVVLAVPVVIPLLKLGLRLLAEAIRRPFTRNARRIEDVLARSPEEFERLCRELFAARGYRVRRTGGQSDGGVDLIAEKDGRTVVVQCKRWTSKPVGVKVVRELFGVLTAEDAAEGYLITTSRFTKDCLDFAKGKPLTLFDKEGFIREIKENLPMTLVDTPHPDSAPAQAVPAEPGPAPAAAEAYPIVCSQCGKADTVPFKPRGDKPLVCRACYAQRRSARAAS